MSLAACWTLHVGAPGGNSDAALGAPTQLGRAPSKKAQRRDAPNSPPARWVGAKRGVCGVAALGNGLAIACALRLASIPVWFQRIPRAKSDRLLGLPLPLVVIHTMLCAGLYLAGLDPIAGSLMDGAPVSTRPARRRTKPGCCATRKLRSYQPAPLLSGQWTCASLFADTG